MKQCIYKCNAILALVVKAEIIKMSRQIKKICFYSFNKILKYLNGFMQSLDILDSYKYTFC